MKPSWPEEAESSLTEISPNTKRQTDERSDMKRSMGSLMRRI